MRKYEEVVEGLKIERGSCGVFFYACSSCCFRAREVVGKLQMACGRSGKKHYMLKQSEMRQPDRVTISLDDETAELFQKVKRESKSSQSELMRAALKFYEKYRAL